MFPIKMTMKRAGFDLTPKEWRAILKDAWEQAGIYWHSQFLPKHFTEQGAAEYQYRPRDPKYTRAKERIKGHRRPLVWSGETERMARAIRDVRSTSTRGVVTLRGLDAKKLWYRRKYAAGPNLVLELMANSAPEAAKLAEVIDQFIQRRVQRLDAISRHLVDIAAGHRQPA